MSLPTFGIKTLDASTRLAMTKIAKSSRYNPFYDIQLFTIHAIRSLQVFPDLLRFHGQLFRSELRVIGCGGDVLELLVADLELPPNRQRLSFHFAQTKVDIIEVFIFLLL